MTSSPGTSRSAAPPDPAKDQPGKPVPPAILDVLILARLLAAWGRHLAGLFPQKGLWRGYATVARFFPNHSLSDTLARIHRGILRAMALERVLLERARRGRDLKVLKRPSKFRVLTPEMFDEEEAAAQDEAPALAQAAAPEAPAQFAEAQPDEAPVEWSRAATPRYDDPQPVWLEQLPSLKELEDEVRRHPIGRTIAAICLDLGVSYKLCDGWFWNALFERMNAYGGNLSGMLMQLHRRELRFEKEDWKQPRGLKLPEQTQEGVRRVVGFLIGERPVDPFGLNPLPWPVAVPGPEAAPGPAPPPCSAAPPGPAAATGTGPP